MKPWITQGSLDVLARCDKLHSSYPLLEKKEKGKTWKVEEKNPIGQF